MMKTRESGRQVLPVPSLKYFREDLERLHLRLRVPACFDDVFNDGFRCFGVQRAPNELGEEPELAVPYVGLIELFDIDQSFGDDLQSSFFSNLTLCCLGQRLRSLNPASRRYPEVV